MAGKSIPEPGYTIEVEGLAVEVLQKLVQVFDVAKVLPVCVHCV